MEGMIQIVSNELNDLKEYILSLQGNEKILSVQTVVRLVEMFDYIIFLWREQLPHQKKERGIFAPKDIVRSCRTSPPLSDLEETESDSGYHELSKRSNHPRHAVKAMKRWLFCHSANPYPTDVEKKQLMEETGLHLDQINHWFINARRRLLVYSQVKPTGRHPFL